MIRNCTHIIKQYASHMSVRVAAQSKAWVCGRWLAGTAGSNPAGDHGCLSVVSVVCCQVKVYASADHSSRGIPTDCGASLCVI